MATTKKTATVKKAVIRKPTAKPAQPAAPAVAAPVKPVVAAPAVAMPVKPVITPAQRHAMVQTEAYFIAEKDGFRGDPATYWAKAEKAVAARLAV